MKKYKNAKIKKSGETYEVIDCTGKIAASGKKLSRSRICEGLPWTWILEKDGNSQVFIEDQSTQTIWAGPEDVLKVKAQLNHLLFCIKDIWYAQYFSSNLRMVLGKAVALKEYCSMGNFLFLNTAGEHAILSCAYENRIRAEVITSWEKMRFQTGEELLAVQYRNQSNLVFWDNDGKTELNNLTLFNGKKNGVIVKRIRENGRLIYKEIYRGPKILLNYLADDIIFHNQDGTVIKLSDNPNLFAKREKNLWMLTNAFIVPNDKTAKSGKLYKIVGDQIKLAAQGNIEIIDDVHYSEFPFCPETKLRITIGKKIFVF